MLNSFNLRSATLSSFAAKCCMQGLLQLAPLGGLAGRAYLRMPHAIRVS